MPPSRYPASQAANVAAGIAFVTAVIFGVGGIVFLRAGDRAGWLLIGLAIAAILGALAVVLGVRRKPGERLP